MLPHSKIISHLARGYVLVVVVVFAMSSLFAAEVTETKSGGTVAIIDTHAHISRGYRRGRALPGAAVPQALRAMDDLRVEMTILLPPPFPPGHPGIYGLRELEPVARANPGRFAFVAGGESLNPMIHRVAPDKVTPDVIREFQQEAESIVKAGAAGFGELTAEHFSFGQGGHPYESTRPDHLLLLALADIAAQHRMPIDLHMEAVPQDMPFPGRLAGGANPSVLKENLAKFERLLAHNRKAKIIWAHAGWDNTGERTLGLMRRLLMENPNLYMSIKIDPGPRPNRPLDKSDAAEMRWVELLQDFPERFIIGSDQFFDEGTDRLALARKFVDALPPDVARLVAQENAKSIYRIEAKRK